MNGTVDKSTKQPTIGIKDNTIVLMKNIPTGQLDLELLVMLFYEMSK